jgi:hypothetical protein
MKLLTLPLLWNVFFFVVCCDLSSRPFDRPWRTWLFVAAYAVLAFLFFVIVLSELFGLHL